MPAGRIVSEAGFLEVARGAAALRLRPLAALAQLWTRTLERGRRRSGPPHRLKTEPPSRRENRSVEAGTVATRHLRETEAPPAFPPSIGAKPASGVLSDLRVTSRRIPPRGAEPGRPFSGPSGDRFTGVQGAARGGTAERSRTEDLPGLASTRDEPSRHHGVPADAGRAEVENRTESGFEPGAGVGRARAPRTPADAGFARAGTAPSSLPFGPAPSSPGEAVRPDPGEPFPSEAAAAPSDSTPLPHEVTAAGFGLRSGERAEAAASNGQVRRRAGFSPVPARPQARSAGGEARPGIEAIFSSPRTTEHAIEAGPAESAPRRSPAGIADAGPSGPPGSTRSSQVPWQAAGKIHSWRVSGAGSDLSAPGSDVGERPTAPPAPEPPAREPVSGRGRAAEIPASAPQENAPLHRARSETKWHGGAVRTGTGASPHQAPDRRIETSPSRPPLGDDPVSEGEFFRSGAESPPAPGYSPKEIHPRAASFLRLRAVGRPDPFALRRELPSDLAGGVAHPAAPEPPAREPASRRVPAAEAPAPHGPEDPPRTPRRRAEGRSERAPLRGADAAAAEGAGPAAAPSGVARIRSDLPAPVETVRHELLAQAIVAKARALPATGAIELRFQLLPEELGPVGVRVASRGRRIRVDIAAATDAALDALSAQLGRLGAALERHGFRDPDVRVGLDFGSRQEGAEGRQAADADARSRPDAQRPGETAGHRPGGLFRPAPAAGRRSSSA